MKPEPPTSCSIPTAPSTTCSLRCRIRPRGIQEFRRRPHLDPEEPGHHAVTSLLPGGWREARMAFLRLDRATFGRWQHRQRWGRRPVSLDRWSRTLAASPASRGIERSRTVLPLIRDSPDRLYLTAWARAAGQHGDGGGIFLSEDAGKTWKQVLEKDRHIYDVTIDPSDSGCSVRGRIRVFGVALGRSRSAPGRASPGFNFKWGQRVVPDPLDHNKIYITTFGGSVWHGSMNGENQPVDIATPALEPGQ